MPRETSPTYDVATARKLASDIVQMLIAAHAQHGPNLILDVIVNLAAGVAIDVGIDAAEICEAITTTHAALMKSAAEQLMARTTTADENKPT